MLIAGLCATGNAIAAQWTVGSATAVPATPVGVPVSLADDGATTDAERFLTFDESRLSAPVASGTLPDAGLNGDQCARVSSNRIVVIRSASTVVPSASTVLCTIPFAVTAAAPAGPIWLVRAIASDTACAVLDDGRRAVLRCVGDHAADPEVRLVRIEGHSAVFAIDDGRASSLHVRVVVGASFNPDALRIRALEAMGPRPGWIETEPVLAPEQVP